ncbi:hypothetical protein HPB50_025870 [Hyalomma asiaticum]|uniref:Uncharacterized protein n=1 Tax=Hyalomma asiaticum TaxID=266040 RepID=A0ACB7TTE4_HYAAI|nr:hypothetical protein HPB50_025870 [Hyalomma asiaticum]
MHVLPNPHELCAPIGRPRMGGTFIAPLSSRHRRRPDIWAAEHVCHQSTDDRPWFRCLHHINPGQRVGLNLSLAACSRDDIGTSMSLPCRPFVSSTRGLARCCGSCSEELFMSVQRGLPRGRDEDTETAVEACDGHWRGTQREGNAAVGNILGGQGATASEGGA